MRRFATVVALAVAIASCSDSNAPETAHVGFYALTSIDGQAPPLVIFESTEGTLEITGGAVTLSANGTFRDSTALRATTADGVETGFEVASGAYTKSGNTITFTPTGSESYQMTLTNNTTLTQFFDEFTLVYTR